MGYATCGDESWEDPDRTSGYSEGRSGAPVRSGKEHTPSAGASNVSSVAGSILAGLNSTAI